MAEAVVTFALERIVDLLVSEGTFLLGVREQIEELQRELERMRCFLEDADKKRGEDKRVCNWVKEIRDIAFKVEDVIETYALGELKKQSSGFREMLKGFACIARDGVSLHKTGNEIQRIKDRLKGIQESFKTYNIQESSSSQYYVQLRNQRLTYAHVDKHFVGKQDDLKLLISHLKNEKNQVVCILGMGGQGKTTLAKQLYNHDDVQNHFEAFAWACLTQKFDKRQLLLDILDQLAPEMLNNSSNMAVEKIVRKLYEVQAEKRCLVVVDDIWEAAHWTSIKDAFPVATTKMGSKVVLTSRTEDVAGEGFSHPLEGLTDDEGWELLAKKAFPVDTPGNLVASPEMETLGRNMVKRCKGLPLAILTLGGLLKGKTFRDWQGTDSDVASYLDRGINKDEYHTVKQVLGLSYDSLPPHLRHCFLHLGTYKEDEEINTEELYLLWIGEGLILDKDKAKEEMLLDVAERHLEELANRSLVQLEPWKVKSTSKYQTCRLHDLIRDFCLSKGKEEKFVCVTIPKPTANTELVRRFCIRNIPEEERMSGISFLKKKDLISQIRALQISYSQKCMLPGYLPRGMSMKEFKLLRIFKIENCHLGKEFQSIGELVYLTYLCIRECFLNKIPSSIRKLRNLQTLDISGQVFVEIPNVLWEIRKLKHLYFPRSWKQKDGEKLRLDGLDELELIENYDTRFCKVEDLFKLQSVRDFRWVQVSAEEAERFIQFMDSNNFRVSYIKVIFKESNPCSNGFLVSFLESSSIDRLKIECFNGSLPKQQYNHHKFSCRLTHLNLSRCKFEEDVMMIVGKLPNLLSLRIFHLEMEEMVCSTMDFPKLLTLEFLYLNLREWRIEEGAFPMLSQVVILRCHKLTMLPDGLRFLTSLKQLRIEGEDRTKWEERVREGGDDFDKVKHIPSVVLIADPQYEARVHILQCYAEYLKAADLT